jgi:hypothetical protein
MDPCTLKKLAGHESMETTMKYTHLKESDSAECLTQVHERLANDAYEQIGCATNRRAEEAEQWGAQCWAHPRKIPALKNFQ